MSDTAFPPPPGDHTQERAPQVLGPDECWSLLRATSVGRVAFVIDGWPVVLPVNYLIDGKEILIRTAPGAKLASARSTVQVSLQADSTESVYRSGWSVLVFGHASEITDANELRRVNALPLRSWAGGDKLYWIKIRPEQITGRRLPRAWQYPDPIQ